MKYRGLKGLVAVTLMCCLLAGCTLTERLDIDGQGSSSETVVNDHEVGYFGLAYYTGAKVNPVLSTARINRMLVEALYEGMFYLDNEFRPQPMLCEKWEGDGTTFRFEIKQGVTFWSGTELTADDVVYSLRAAKANETSPYYTRMQDVSSIYAQDKYTVGVTLTAPNIDFPRLMDIPVFRAGSEEDTFSDGTGAYQPASEEGNWRLIPYTGWHGGTIGVFSRIDLVTTVRADAAVHSFETGDISMLRTERISAEPVSISGAVDLYQTPTTTMHYLAFGTVAGPCSLPAVRRALSSMIGRTSICDTQLQSFANPAVLPMNPQPSEPQTRLKIDRDAALAELSAAGITDTNGDGVLDYDNGNGGRTALELGILVNSENAFKVAVAQQIADSLVGIGISARVDQVSFDEYNARLAAGDFQIYYGETRMTPDFDLRSLICSGGAMNFGRYSNIDVDQAVLSFREMGTDEARQNLYTKLLDEMPIAPIAFVRDQVAVRSNLIAGFTPSPYWLFHGVAGWRKNK